MQLFDTYSRSLAEVPRGKPVGMYFCGPTVYGPAHVGNARPFVVGMWMRNWLREQGYEATLVHNITDVNDKIYDAAPGASAALAERATAGYLKDIGDIGLGLPDVLPKVTEHIPEIVAFVRELVDRELAYPVDGDVYFRVARFPEYGRLSGNRPDRMEDLEPNPLKEDPRDFALWKATKPGEDTHWPSPWGEGRPGWHIECSAMAEEILGTAFEIHGGGIDLVFPHHENELAQSRALGHEFARIWAHNGLLQFTGDKMSKSVGNIATIREVLDRWGREALLVFFLGGHWRKPIDFSEETMAQAAASWARLGEVTIDPAGPRGASPSWEDFAAALDHDFNTPDALSLLNRWQRIGDGDLLTRGLQVFGLPRPAHRVQAGLTDEGGAAGSPVAQVPQEIRDLAELREAARAARDFPEADRLRGQIEAAGWVIEDTAEGPRLVLVR